MSYIGTLYDRMPSSRGSLLPLQSCCSNSGVESSTLHYTSSSNQNLTHSSSKFTNQSLPIFRTSMHNHQSHTATPTLPRTFSVMKKCQSPFPHQPPPARIQFTVQTTLAAPAISPQCDNSQYSCNASSSYTASSKKNFSAPIKEQKPIWPVWKGTTSSGHSSQSEAVLDNDAPKSVKVATCAQLGGEGSVSKGAQLQVPLSPLNITLSQVCEMENSQIHGDLVQKTRSTRECAKSGEVTEDSGYISHEVSALKSPSPFQIEQNKQDDCDIVNEDVTDLLFAEVAMEDLDDTLDLNDTLNPDDTQDIETDLKNNKHQTTPSNDSRNTSKHGDATIPEDMTPDDMDVTQNVDNTQSCSVKQQLGSLLEVRYQHRSCRMPLRDAVGDLPPRRWSSVQLQSLGVPNPVQAVTSCNIENFRFTKEYFSSSALSERGSVCVGDGAMVSVVHGSAGIMELWNAFRISPGVDVKLISYKWFYNHFKSLVMKLASMEVTYPHLFAGRCLTPDWLMIQIKYRYDREIDGAERSALHKICEHDDVPSRRMVLYVSKCYTTADGESKAGDKTWYHQNKSTFQEENMQEEAKLDLPSIEVSDGWYSLPCVLDRPLKHMLKRGKLRVGTKLMLCGAELVGLSSPCHPLAVPETAYLKISANSTRRARWFARLGYQSNPHPFAVPMESLFSDGGKVGCVNAIIARVYPFTYLEKKENCKKMRCERLEQKEQSHYEKERERVIDGISSCVQKEFESELASHTASTSKRRSRRLNILQIKQLQDGEEIYAALINTPDPQAIQVFILYIAFLDRKLLLLMWSRY